MSIINLKEAEELIRDGKRYRYLRNVDTDTIVRGGVFIGLVDGSDKSVINGEDVDIQVDAAMNGRKAQKRRIYEYGFRMALEQLRDHQQQLDHDGVMVGVSRQALDEILVMFKDIPSAEPS